MREFHYREFEQYQGTRQEEIVTNNQKLPDDYSGMMVDAVDLISKNPGTGKDQGDG